ncbi:hypothetical protein F441_20839 [Phytophthora nicotianae CJ01A1]|uniref:RNase H type-1 domain-containing protein n=1 Tax=Phytophthora nicotianae CJ01A1 TaxID=1317063 RepID=W2VUL9_PHYNI|nr:hypothetical protein F441_20839 [Phytophthora nicotianae CJ01A1]
MAEDEQICYHEGGDLYAQVIGDGMAVIPEVLPTTEEVKIEDIHLVPDASLPVEVEKLRQEIWNSRHLPIRKALSPAARGVRDKILVLLRVLQSARGAIYPDADPALQVGFSNQPASMGALASGLLCSCHELWRSRSIYREKTRSWEFMQQESRPVKGRRGAHPDHAQKRAQPIDPDCDPDVKVLKARSAYGEGFTVNEAEYHGLLLGLGQLSEADQKQLVICGDSNLMARQWIGDDLVHVKRDWNASADSLASSALQKQCKIEVEVEFDYQDTITVNRLEEGFVARSEV